MTEHYSHVDRAEKLRAADQVVALTVSAPPPTTTLRQPRPQVGDQVGD
jgi:hypothetical protein